MFDAETKGFGCDLKAAALWSFSDNMKRMMLQINSTTLCSCFAAHSPVIYNDSSDSTGLRLTLKRITGPVSCHSPPQQATSHVLDKDSPSCRQKKEIGS